MLEVDKEKTPGPVIVFVHGTDKMSDKLDDYDAIV